MKSSNIWVAMLMLCLFLGPAVWAQAPASANQSGAFPAPSASAAAVPRLIKFSGTLLDAENRPMTGPLGVTFALYAEQTGGAALWIETQSVKPDAEGNYTVLLGASSANGVLTELFNTGEARWLGVQVERQPEQPRVLLVSVPYALKAGDATTVGGLPPSAFALAGSNPSPSGQPSLLLPLAASAQSRAPLAAGTLDVTTAGGTVNKLAKFDTSTDITSSLIFDNGTNVSIGNTSPAAKLDVSGSGIFRGFLELPSTGTATATLGFNSQPFDLFASSFNSSTHAAVGQHFRWQAEPVGNDTTSPLGKLNLLFASGTGTLTETGLSISNKGLITFASGQAFPTVTGNETVTGNLSAQQLISNVTTGMPPLSVKSTTLVPNLNASLLGGLPASSFATLGANTFSGSQSVMGNVSATGGIQGTVGVFSGNGVFDILSATQAGEGPAVFGTATNSIGATTIGVWGASNSPTGQGVLGQNGAASTSAIGVLGSAAGMGVKGQVVPAGLGAVGDAGLFDNNTGGNILSGQVNGAERFRVEGTGRTVVLAAGSRNALSLTRTFNGSNEPGTSAALQVLNTDVGEAAWLNNSEIANPFSVLKLVMSSGSTSNFLECDIPDGTRKCHITSTGTFVSGSDFAEALPARGDRKGYEPGDVLVMARNGSGVEKTAGSYSPRVAGVYSTRPGLLGAEKNGATRVDPNDVPIAIVGIVPTKVSAENGPIEVGNLLVTSSTPGYAMKGTNRRRMSGAIVGKALEPLGKGKGVIQVLVTLQ